MAFHATPVDAQDVEGMRSLAFEGAGTHGEGVSLEDFQKHAAEKYGLPEDAATLIFTRTNTQENGLYDEGELSQEQFEAADENLKAFDAIVEKYDLKGMDSEVALLLTGDADGKMSVEDVDKLIDEGYIEIKDGQMKLTEDGHQFFDYLKLDGDTDLIGSKDILAHLDDFKQIA